MKDKFILVDLYAGSFEMKHESLNELANPVDGRFYAYVPPHNTIDIARLGAGPDEDFIDDIPVIFTKALSKKNTDRTITGFYPSARIHKKSKTDPHLKRQLRGQDISYIIESDDYIKVGENSSFTIETARYNPYMFRYQRSYSGLYPELDEKIMAFIAHILKGDKLEDDIPYQDQIQKSPPADEDEAREAVYKPYVIKEAGGNYRVVKDPKLARRVLSLADYRCSVDPDHITFVTKRNVPYMEGHHLIPCRPDLVRYFYDKYHVNLDCPENIVPLCPNCHKAVHLGNDTSKMRILERIFEKRRASLKEIGIDITFSDLLNFYGIKNFNTYKQLNFID